STSITTTILSSCGNNGNECGVKQTSIVFFSAINSLTLVERGLYGISLNQFIAYFNINLSSGFGEFSLNIAKTNRLLQRWRLCTGSNNTNTISVSIGNFITMTRYAFIYHNKASKFLTHAFFFLFFYFNRIGKVFCEFSNPAKTSLNR